MILTALCVPLLLVATETPANVLNDVLPAPQRVEAREGVFPCDWDRLSFVLKTPTKEAADALGDRLREVQERWPVSGGGLISEYPVKDTFALTVFSEGQPPAADPPGLMDDARQEGYALTVTPQGIAVGAATERGLFYGMMTMAQLFDGAKARRRDAIPCVHVVDWPKVAMRGFHEDYGRDQIPTIEDQKRTIRLLAQYKMNTHLWFIEPDHFVYKFDPEIGQDYDRFTFDEIREVVAYARKHYIEVIPVVELLAHMENTLSHPKYADLAEVKGSGTICPTGEESFAFVRRLIDEIAPAFEGRYFHCGLDESAAVGQGKSAEAVKAKGIERVYADYYTRLNDVVKAHGKTMMMYADIVLNHPAVMDLLPKDIVMMYWNYGDAEHHPGFDTLAQRGFKTVSLSAVWDWVNLYPLYPFAFRNIERLAAQTAALGALGTFTADWGDWNLGAAGANLSELNYYGVVYGAAEGWHPEPIALDTFSRAFAVQFFGLGSEDAAEAFSLLARSQGDGVVWTTRARMMFHSVPREQIPAMTKAPAEELAFWRDLKALAGRAHVLLKKSAARQNADYLRSYDLAARMLECAADLALQYRATADAMGGPRFDARKHAKAYEDLAARQQALWKEYREMYAATNRPINLRYLARAWDKSQQDLTEFAAALRRGETISPKG
jgi:hypothetical protein